MEPRVFEEFFAILSKNLPVKLIGKELKATEYCLKVKDNLPVLDAIELLGKHACLVTESGLVITRKQMLNKPVKTLFYALIVEIEYRLYRILKPYVKSVKELQTYTMNDLIREFLKNEKLFEVQDIYTKKKEIKEDLKAISSFRNIIMHANRKIDLETEFTPILKRKRQAFRLLEALGQMYHQNE